MVSLTLQDSINLQLPWNIQLYWTSATRQMLSHGPSPCHLIYPLKLYGVTSLLFWQVMMYQRSQVACSSSQKIKWNILCGSNHIMSRPLNVPYLLWSLWRGLLFLPGNIIVPPVPQTSAQFTPTCSLHQGLLSLPQEVLPVPPSLSPTVPVSSPPTCFHFPIPASVILLKVSMY